MRIWMPNWPYSRRSEEHPRSYYTASTSTRRISLVREILSILSFYLFDERFPTLEREHKQLWFAVHENYALRKLSFQFVAFIVDSCFENVSRSFLFHNPTSHSTFLIQTRCIAPLSRVPLIFPPFLLSWNGKNRSRRAMSALSSFPILSSTIFPAK